MVLIILLVIMFVSAEEIQNNGEKLNYTDRSISVSVEGDIPNLIRNFGYMVETHHVITADGYVLEAHRIPVVKRYISGDTPIPVLIMHGLLGSSADFVIKGPNKALALLLADEGYDVWLGNSRGNRYSRSHVNIDPDSDHDFWKFSWDEIGNYDLPAFVDYIQQVTNKKKIHYIGFSQGSTAFLVLNSLKPEYNEKFISFMALAPVAYFTHNQSPLIASLGRLETIIEEFAGDFGIREMSPNKCDEIKAVRSGFEVERWICNIYRSINFQNVEKALIPMIQAYEPAGASVRQFVHYGQCIKFDCFCRFNHGVDINTKLYNSSRPPEYNITRVTVPTAVFFGIKDTYAQYRDLQKLATTLPNATIHQVSDVQFTHSDFLFHKQAKELLYDDMMKILRKFESGHYAEVNNTLIAKEDELMSSSQNSSNIFTQLLNSWGMAY